MSLCETAADAVPPARAASARARAPGALLGENWVPNDHIEHLELQPSSPAPGPKEDVDRTGPMTGRQMTPDGRCVRSGASNFSFEFVATISTLIRPLLHEKRVSNDD